jgi:predicted acetyltransferase
MIDASPFILRRAEDRDRSAFINLSRLAFSPMTGLAEAEQDGHDLPLNPDQRQGWVVEDAQTQAIVGRYRELDLATFFQGVRMPLSGLGGVSVAIERRGEKIAQVMVEHALQLARDRQIPLSMLYPFQHGFYRKLGWAWVNAPHQYPVKTSNLPRYAERSQVTTVQLEHHSGLQAVYEKMAPTQNGWLDRQPWHWEEFFKPEGGYEIYQYVEAGTCQGYVAISFKRLESANRTWAVIVEEWVALNASAYRGILGFLASLRDQVETIIWNTHAADPFPHLLKEQRSNPMLHPRAFEFGFIDLFGAIGGGFMWRLVDVKKALELRPVLPVDAGSLSFQIVDPVFGPQSIAVEFGDRVMHCSDRPASTTLKLTIDHLTALFCGIRTAQELVWTGEAELEGDRAGLTALDRAWQAPAPFCWNFF